MSEVWGNNSIYFKKKMISTYRKVGRIELTVDAKPGMYSRHSDLTLQDHSCERQMEE